MVDTIGRAVTVRLRSGAPSAGVQVIESRRQAEFVPSLILRLEPLAPESPHRVPSDLLGDVSSDFPASPVIDLAAADDAAAEAAPAAGSDPADPTLRRWSAAAAAAQDGCLVLDPQGQVVSLSATAAELLDCSDNGVIGRRLIDVTTLIDF